MIGYLQHKNYSNLESVKNFYKSMRKAINPVDQEKQL